MTWLLYENKRRSRDNVHIPKEDSYEKQALDLINAFKLESPDDFKSDNYSKKLWNKLNKKLSLAKKIDKLIYKFNEEK